PGGGPGQPAPGSIRDAARAVRRGPAVAVMTYLEAIADGLRQALRADPSVILLGEDVAAYGGAFKLTKGFLDEFGPRRVIDTPISEAGAAGAAGGAALQSRRPVVQVHLA